MCYAKPGPRCSNHAHKKYVKAQQKLEEAKNKTENLPAGKERIAANIKVYEAREELNAAEKMFHTTPAGMKMLQTQQKEYFRKYNFESPVLNDKIEHATQLRARQKALYDAQKHKTSNPHEYAADEDNIEKLTEQLKTGYNGKNIYIGRETVQPSNLDEITMKRYQTHQKRLDNLVECYRTTGGDINITSQLIEDYDKNGLTPGYKLLGMGSYQAAYLDEVSGDVIKIPVRYRTGAYYVGRNDEDVEDEQYNYAVLNVEKLNDNEAEYVETLFYRSTEEPDLNVVIQPYLDPSKYDKVGDRADADEKGFKAAKLLSKIPGLGDIHDDNYYINKQTGNIILFDCLTTI